ncbi:S-adenosyl-L-methionine-dependent methyltransferase [Flagelloscypha sp. PMI_526]|nr:S-adenosyl-L-methionine-dependent methyltransferase [Flagelloscypha sp. PMI_526]
MSTFPIPNDSNVTNTGRIACSSEAKDGTTTECACKATDSVVYSVEQLQAVPEESHRVLSCGNPTKAATLQPGESVLDLGSGGGIDTFLAAAKVGLDGFAIGLDISPEVVSQARSSAQRQGMFPPHVAFVEVSPHSAALPIKSNSIDCVLSNCLPSFLPMVKKSTVFREIYRVLKPGGRVVLDDIIAKKDFSPQMKEDLGYYVGCIAGAIKIEQYQTLMRDAGFPDPEFVDNKADLNVYVTPTYVESNPSGCCGVPEPESNQSNCCGACGDQSQSVSSPDDILARLRGEDLNRLAAAYQIYAIKPKKDAIEISSVKETPLLKWWDAFPAVQEANIPVMQRDELRKKVKHISELRLAIIDVRNFDYAGGHIKGSVQLIAQTFHNDLHGFHERFVTKEDVVFYCGSSSGRAPRCAGWYMDHLTAQKVSPQPRVWILEGGMKGWLEDFEGDDSIEY